MQNESVQPASESTYSERLTAPAAWWLTAVAFGLSFGWIVFVATTATWAVVGALAAVAVSCAVVWAYGNIRVLAGPQGLRVGDAHLPLEVVGTVTELDRVQFRAELGPNADARAWLRTRPYVDGGVRVGVADPTDPTPYWLISCRRPDAVAAALGSRVGQTDV